MIVRQLMSTEPRTCSPEDSLQTAAQLLWEHDIGAVAVVSGERVVGVITDRDICMAAYTQGRPLHELGVSSSMARKLHTCGPDDAIDAALRVMSEHQVRRLPVVDAQGRLEGMLSINDLARESARPKTKLQREAVLAMIAAVCEPRADAAQAHAATSVGAATPTRSRRGAAATS